MTKKFNLPQFTLRALVTAVLIGVPYSMALKGAEVPPELFTAAWAAAASALGVDAVRALGGPVIRPLGSPEKRVD